MNRIEYFLDVIKKIYEDTTSESNDIISHAQNPVAALGIIAALLIYMAQGAKGFPDIKAYIDILLAAFYIFIVITFILVSLSCYYLLLIFRTKGYERNDIGPIEYFCSKYEDEKVSEIEFIREISKSYIDASILNRKQNEKRREYVRKSMEIIMKAVVFCLITGVLYCSITIIS